MEDEFEANLKAVFDNCQNDSLAVTKCFFLLLVQFNAFSMILNFNSIASIQIEKH